MRDQNGKSDGLMGFAKSCCMRVTIQTLSEIMTIRVDRKTKARLEKLARVMDRARSYVAAEASRACVDLNEWQIGESKAAPKEADAGDFATEEGIKAVMRKWGRGAGE